MGRGPRHLPRQAVPQLGLARRGCVPQFRARFCRAGDRAAARAVSGEAGWRRIMGVGLKADADMMRRARPCNSFPAISCQTTDGCSGFISEIGPATDDPQFKYGKKEVRRAGEALAGVPGRVLINRWWTLPDPCTL